jgi:hypothetical protein
MSRNSKDLTTWIYLPLSVPITTTILDQVLNISYLDSCLVDYYLAQSTLLLSEPSFPKQIWLFHMLPRLSTLKLSGFPLLLEGRLKSLVCLTDPHKAGPCLISLRASSCSLCCSHTNRLSHAPPTAGLPFVQFLLPGMPGITGMLFIHTSP